MSGRLRRSSHANGLDPVQAPPRLAGCVLLPEVLDAEGVHTPEASGGTLNEPSTNSVAGFVFCPGFEYECAWGHTRKTLRC
jgi:hypothetical protein